MFDLNAWIDLDKVEIIRIGVYEEFNRGGVVELDSAADGEGGVKDALTQSRVKIRRGSDLDDFLMAPLNRAIALEKVDQAAVLVAKQLDFNVTGAANKFFEKNVSGAEGGAGLTPRLIESVVELVGRQRDAHAATAAAVGRLDHDGITEAFGERMGFFIGADRLIAAGKDGNLRLLSDAARRHLVAELFENFGARPNENKAGLTNGAGEMRILGEEAVAGMNGVHIMFAGQRDDAGNVEIGPDRFACLADAIGFIGFEAMQSEAVFMRIESDRAYP